MLYRPLMIPLKRKHLIKSITGLLIIPKSDRTKSAIEYLQSIVLRSLISLGIPQALEAIPQSNHKTLHQDMLLTKRFQLMITLSDLFCSSKKRHSQDPDRRSYQTAGHYSKEQPMAHPVLQKLSPTIWRLLRSHSVWRHRYNIPQYYPEHSGFSFA